MNGSLLPRFPLPWKRGGDPAYLRRREWLVTNGLGGYASGTVAGGVSRRQHGLFVPNLPAPRGRTMMVPFLQDEIVSGDRAVSLGELELAGGRYEGESVEHLEQFWLEGQVPVWTFGLNGHSVERRVIMMNEQNTVCVSYTLRQGDSVLLRLRPYTTLRSHGSLGGPATPPILTIQGPRFEVRAEDGAPPLYMRLEPEAGRFVVSSCRRDDVFLRVEHNRGYDHLDRWQSPGFFEVELRADRPVFLLAGTEAWPALDVKPAAIFEAEERRCNRLVTLAAAPLRQGRAAQLLVAADQFLVFPGTRLEEAVLAHAEGGEARTVIAGYHWFTDWGRDTMISLEGLTLVTGRPREARWILRTFAHYIRDGLIPNNFPEGERTGVYHTTDATLWYFHALDRYVETVRDHQTLADLYPVLRGVIEHHLAGTRFGIHADPGDGLLLAGDPDLPLTWMDAKVEDWVVTPRRGKAVEIQALWYNALRLMEHWASVVHQDPDDYAKLAERAGRSFNQRFWIERERYLRDLVDGPAGDDATFRPNQIFSAALRFPILAEDRWRRVVDVVGERLLTPYGLRTLDPAHPDFKKMYSGDLRARDAAYHQGTVWPWLIGPFVSAWRRAYPEKPPASLLDGLLDHMTDAGIGTISEIFDAEQPFHPRGCIAQAWSVAEVLRVLAMI